MKKTLLALALSGIMFGSFAAPTQPKKHASTAATTTMATAKADTSKKKATVSHNKKMVKSAKAKHTSK